MKRSCNCNNTGKGRRCGLCNDREKRLSQRPTWAQSCGLPLRWKQGLAHQGCCRACVESLYGCSVLSFAPDPRTLALVTVDGTPVSYDSWEHADKIVLVTKGEADTMDQEERMKQFDKRLLVLVQSGWKQ
jgi:hypothetical protein